MKRLALHLEPYALALDAPLVTAAGVFTHRRGVHLTLADETGALGRGEVAPWPGFGAGPEAVAVALARLPEAVERWPEVSGLDDVGALMADLRAAPEVAFGVELALLELLARRQGCPVAALWGGAVRRAVPTHRLVTDADDAAHARRAGVRHLKVKVGAGSLADDDARLARVRQAVGPEVSLRLDANGAWAPDEAIEALRMLGRHGLELVEQPVAADDVAGLARVRRLGGVPVAADEALCRPGGVEAVLEAEAADVLVLKPMFLGGLLASRRVAALGQARGLGVMVTHALEGAVGRLGALHLAASLSEPLLACGLAGRPADGGAFPELRGGVVPLPTGAGLGLEGRR